MMIVSSAARRLRVSVWFTYLLAPSHSSVSPSLQTIFVDDMPVSCRNRNDLKAITTNDAMVH